MRYRAGNGFFGAGAIINGDGRCNAAAARQDPKAHFAVVNRHLHIVGWAAAMPDKKRTDQLALVDELSTSLFAQKPEPFLLCDVERTAVDEVEISRELLPEYAGVL